MKVQFLEPIASVTVDCVIFGIDGKELKVLLIKRGSEPDLGKWALPGGFMEKDETLEEAAQRVLEQLTGVANVYMEQFYSFSKVDRHPLSRVITVGYYALIDSSHQELNPSWHASETKWISREDISKIDLGFDHKEIFDRAFKTLKKGITSAPIGFELLPTKFTLTELQNLYEIILDEKIDRRNFRRKIKSMNILKELKEVKKGAHIGATLYKLDKTQYDALRSKGFDFRL
jgi:8-oxo-dGTP diphosphatase